MLNRTRSEKNTPQACSVVDGETAGVTYDGSKFLRVILEFVAHLASLGALAHPEIARAYVLRGDTQKARSAYNDFLILWKDADPNIPLLKQAKSEYSNLP